MRQPALTSGLIIFTSPSHSVHKKKYEGGRRGEGGREEAAREGGEGRAGSRMPRGASGTRSSSGPVGAAGAAGEGLGPCGAERVVCSSSPGTETIVDPGCSSPPVRMGMKQRSKHPKPGGFPKP